jgi:hypothetical protein
MLGGRRVRLREVAALLAIVVVAGFVAGLVDLARPEESRTHVGRFFARLFESPDAAMTIVARKADASLASLSGSVLLGMVPIAVALVAWVWKGPSDEWRRRARELPTLRATATAFVVVGVLGFALNDSGVTIPGMMLVVAVCAVILSTAGHRDVGAPAVTAADPVPARVP